ncbi:hypothetical protein EW146_g8174 [Bondarzewia mesenterica]|uniref:ATP-dependent DNA helicase n=1 Tax=Bondarzewia mesenterica TaxID=1095465 RepID=A0A4S4LGI0_9AGAM|nr:hypothetical protein EW146_g8174 [Bondarzewia mesenterica]
MLLKPWRSLLSDLKLPDENWSTAFERFIVDASVEVKRTISGFQYYHECQSAAKQARNSSRGDAEEFGGIEAESIVDDDVLAKDSYTEENLGKLLAMTHGPRDVMYAEMAILHAVEAGIFKRDHNVEEWDAKIAKRGVSRDNPPPLRIILSGEGGTGKSKVIQTITEAFHQRGASSLLVKAAYTGIAASLISGKTTHTICMLSQKLDKMSAERKKQLESEWSEKKYLIIDEYSMISKPFLAKISKRISIAKTNAVDGTSFGGISVILCGDHHQFPPVACRASDTLYWPCEQRESNESQTSGQIFQEFKDVVKLTEQMRVTDLIWLAFLQNLRYGCIQEEDLIMLHRQILNTVHCPPTDFSTDPWKNASLVTPRHAVHIRWNTEATERHCEMTPAINFMCSAKDKAKATGLRKLTLSEQIKVAKTLRPRDRSKMETTEKPATGCHARGRNEDERVIPIEPSVETFTIHPMDQFEKAKPTTVHRSQFPITAAYAFTDYHAQGQSITLFNLYVALSRSSGRDTIRLLRDFNDEIFLTSHNPAVLDEDDRLDILDMKTKEWWAKTLQSSRKID